MIYSTELNERSKKKADNYLTPIERSRRKMVLGIADYTFWILSKSNVFSDVEKVQISILHRRMKRNFTLESFKEMSIEERESAYHEAIERIRYWRNEYSKRCPLEHKMEELKSRRIETGTDEVAAEDTGKELDPDFPDKETSVGDVDEDFYTQLGLIPEAEDGVVKAVYLTLTAKYKHKKGKDDLEKLKRVKKAYIEIGKARGWLQALKKPEFDQASPEKGEIESKAEIEASAPAEMKDIPPAEATDEKIVEGVETTDLS